MELKKLDELRREALHAVEELTSAERAELLAYLIRAFPERFACDPATGTYHAIPREAPPSGGSCL